MARPRALRTPPARGTSTVRHAELLGQGQACIPPAPPKASRAKLSRVEAAFDADHAQRPHHLRVRHPHYAEGGLLRVQADLSPSMQRLLGEVASQHTSPPSSAPSAR